MDEHCGNGLDCNSHTRSLWRAGTGVLRVGNYCRRIGSGRRASPFSSSVYLATEALIAFGSESQKQRWLPGLASGETIATLAHAEGAGQTTAKSLTASLSGDSLTGAKKPVADGAAANIAIVTTTAGDGSVTLCLVELDQGTVVRTPIQTLDFSRGHATLEFNNASAEPLGNGTIPWSSFESLLDRAAVLMAWEQLGIADKALEQACDYAQQRYAFGRAIGSFQAIKHKLAGMYVKNALARSNAYHGAWALASDSDTLPLAASTARVASIQASLNAAQENIQTHGGMGFTWEFDCQFYYRRAKLLSLAIGSERHWQDRLVTALEQQDPAAA